MNRLLTGYAVPFNRRHRRAGIENDMDALARYPWSGHAVLLGHATLEGQAVDDVLGRFGSKVREARARYAAFVAAGVPRGRREELVGGGLRRSLAFLGKTERRESFDARALGSGAFVEELWREEELRHRLPPNLTRLDLAGRVAEPFDVPVAQVLRRTHGTQATAARQVICHVATRILGARGAVVGDYLEMGQSSVSRSAALGRQVWEADQALRALVLVKNGEYSNTPGRAPESPPTIQLRQPP